MQIFNTEERNRNMENHKVERSEIPNTFGFERSEIPNTFGFERPGEICDDLILI